ncbi:MAG TPA: PilZ domain-containing protein [Candidatus Omnitrophota bacterium]|nr:PilZ domain-containing protein [Candidatus Omnitrophota bacterium]
MNSKEEAVAYLQKVLAQERATIHKIQEVISVVKDPQIKSPLEDVFRDEVRHGSFAVLIYSLLQGVAQEEVKAYVFFRQLLDSLLPRPGREKRRYLREPVLGVVRMRSRESALRYEAKCMDFSLSGIGFESDRNVPVNDIYDCEIELYGRPVSLERSGKVIWTKEVLPGTFFGGVEFEGV